MKPNSSVMWSVILGIYDRWIYAVGGLIIGRGRQKRSHENLALCHFIHNRSHMDDTGIEPRLHLWHIKRSVMQYFTYGINRLDLLASFLFNCYTFPSSVHPCIPICRSGHPAILLTCCQQNGRVLWLASLGPEMDRMVGREVGSLECLHLYHPWDFFPSLCDIIWILSEVCSTCMIFQWLACSCPLLAGCC